MNKLSSVAQRFVLHWGEMGARWGVNRTVAQIHALLYLAGKPVNADDMVEALGVARSNVSTSLKELQGWGLVRLAHVLGDRRDHFEALGDPWEMMRIIVEQRKRREIDPTIALLRELKAEAERASGADAQLRGRLAGLLDLFDSLDAWYHEMARLPAGALAQVLRLGGKLRRLLGVGVKA